MHKLPQLKSQTMDQVDLLKQQLREMLRIRLIEEAIADEYPKQEMRCPVHLSIGQEAVAVGVCGALSKVDQVVSTHRAHAHFLAKGGCLKSFLAEIYGKKTGCCGGKGGSMHLVDLDAGFLMATPIVGGSIPVAVGAAHGKKVLGKEGLTAVFFGEGTTEEGVFSESLNYAALRKLPVLFVCENNLYSVYSPLEVRQPEERSRVEIARAHGVKGFLGDGNSMEEVNAMMEQAKDLLHRGEGPVYLEFSTYRWREHCGPNYDNDLGYRSEEEFLHWKKLCPIENLSREMESAGLLTQDEMAMWREEIFTELNAAFLFAKESDFPSPEGLYENLFAE